MKNFIATIQLPRSKVLENYAKRHNVTTQIDVGLPHSPQGLPQIDIGLPHSPQGLPQNDTGLPHSPQDNLGLPQIEESRNHTLNTTFQEDNSDLSPIGNEIPTQFYADDFPCRDLPQMKGRVVLGQLPHNTELPQLLPLNLENSSGPMNMTLLLVTTTLLCKIHPKRQMWNIIM